MGGSKWSKARMALGLKLNSCLYVPSTVEDSPAARSSGAASLSPTPPRDSGEAVKMPTTPTPSSSGLRLPKQSSKSSSKVKNGILCFVDKIGFLFFIFHFISCMSIH